MKKSIIIKSFLLVAVTIAIIAYPAKLCADVLVRQKQYTELCYNLPCNWAGANQSGQCAEFYGNNAQKNASDFVEKLRKTEGVTGTHTFNTNPDLITGLYKGVDNLDYETTVEKIASKADTQFYCRSLKVKNAEGAAVTNSAAYYDGKLAIGSYELPEMFKAADYLNCKEGRYINTDAEYKTGDTVEIMVTDGVGLIIGDKCFISLDALDENDKLVVVKAEVVGIAAKGLFLPYYGGYYSSFGTTVSDVYDRVFNGEMIYYPDLSGFYKYNSNLKPIESDYNDSTTMVMYSMNNENQPDTSEILKQFDGINSSNRKGLGGDSSNLYSFRLFGNYNDIAFSDELSVSQTEVYLAVSSLVFMAILIISVTVKIASMLKKGKSDENDQGE